MLPKNGTSSLLLKNAAIVSVDEGTGCIPSGDILIRGNTIAEIGEHLDEPGSEVIDATGMIAMPGFVDGHRHLWEGLLRNSLPDGDLADYLKAVNGQFAPAYTAEDAYVGELISALGALDAGVTTVFDWSHIQNSPDHTTAVLEALGRSGIRAVFGYGPPGYSDHVDGWPRGIGRLRQESFSGPVGLLTLALATFSPEVLPYETTKEHFRLARDAGALISIHAGLNGVGKKDQIERLGRDGLLGPDVNLVHCNGLSDTEWKLIADTGASVSITPSTEMQMGQGVPPLRQALGVGITPSLGIDVEVCAPGDMWTQMRLLFALQRSQVFEDRYAGRPAADLATTAQMLEFATMGGATACGLASVTGSLSVGKQADVVLLRPDGFHAVPVNDLTGSVVHTMDARNVDTVIVAGRPVKRNGHLLGATVDDLADHIHRARDRVFAAAGVTHAAADLS